MSDAGHATIGLDDLTGQLRDAAALIVPVQRAGDAFALSTAVAPAVDSLPADTRAAIAALLPVIAARANDTTAAAIPVAGGGGIWRLVLCVVDETLPRPEALFAAALAAGRRVETGRMLSLLPWVTASAAELEVVATGHIVGRWGWSRRDDESANGIVLVVPDEVDDGTLRRARVIAEEMNWVRRLVETPPNALGPLELAEQIAQRAAAAGRGSLSATIWDRRELERRGFGATIAVGAASAREPLAVCLSLDGTGPLLGMAGKGITFDSGGLNLKRDAGEIAWMKSDMAAAASVAGAMIAAAALGAGPPAVAVLPLAENAVGPSALRPGDVVRHPGGRTTEVVDTDSEGRLVLADALAWLAGSRSDTLIDVGTLSDSGAVGTAFWGCWSTSDLLADALIAAGSRTGDPGWRLPLHSRYRQLLVSRVADSANAPMSTPDTGQLAATYLRPFAGDTPWAHIDIGSAAYLVEDAEPWPAGPTATPLRVLVEMLRPREA